MKEFIDVRTQQIYKYNDKDIFSVYVRRSNGKKKLIHVGLVPQKAFDIYYSFKIFKLDRKYLMIKPLNNANEVEILSLAGVDKKPDRKCGGSFKANFSRSNLRNISNVPESLRIEFKKKIEGLLDDEDKLMTINRAIPILMSYFLTLDDDQIESINAIGKKELLRQVILSGGDNTAKIKIALIEDQKK